MGDQISQREVRNDSDRIMRAPDQGRSFVAAADAVETFRHAPGLDWQRMCQDLDEVVDQDITTRG